MSTPPSTRAAVRINVRIRADSYGFVRRLRSFVRRRIRANQRACHVRCLPLIPPPPLPHRRGSWKPWRVGPAVVPVASLPSECAPWNEWTDGNGRSRLMFSLRRVFRSSSGSCTWRNTNRAIASTRLDKSPTQPGLGCMMKPANERQTCISTCISQWQRFVRVSSLFIEPHYESNPKFPLFSGTLPCWTIYFARALRSTASFSRESDPSWDLERERRCLMRALQPENDIHDGLHETRMNRA